MDGAMCPIGVVSLLFFHIYHIVNWPLNRVTKEGGRGGEEGGEEEEEEYSTPVGKRFLY